MATHFRTNHYILSAFSEIKLLYLCTNAWQPIQKGNLPIKSKPRHLGAMEELLNFCPRTNRVMAIQQVERFVVHLATMHSF